MLNQKKTPNELAKEAVKILEESKENRGHDTYSQQINDKGEVPYTFVFGILEKSTLPNMSKDDRHKLISAAMDAQFGKDGWEPRKKGELRWICKKTKTEKAPASSPVSQEQETDQEQKTEIVEQHYPLNQILYGPPGTGKTWNTVNSAVEIVENKPIANEKRTDIKRKFNSLKQKGRIEMVTFHQNYSYEDFIEGIRPVLSNSDKETKDKNSDIKYQLKPGVFKSIVNRANRAKNKQNRQNYVLIIDEINRGNIAKIFGELITLIEPSKRLGEGDEATVTLPYSNRKFGIPNNLYIIGTMNTADRSINPLDTALRRRFDFIEMIPDPNHPEISNDIEGVNCQKLLEKMNERICFLHDRDHQIGHTYFIGVKKMASLAKTFQNQIIPLLQEYFYDNWEKIDLVLNKNGFIKSSDVDKSLFKSSDLVDDDRKIYELLPAIKNEKEDKWRDPDYYKKIYEPGDQPSQDGQDNQSE